MKIDYLATANIPSKSANSLQIIKMCEALSLLGHEVNLFIPNYDTIEVSTYKYYDLKKKFPIIRVGNKIKKINKINNFFLPLKIVFQSLKKNKNQIYITRNLVISFFLILLKKKHIFELHDDLYIFGKKIAFTYSIFNLINSKYISKVVFITHSLKKFITKKYGYNKNNFEIIPDATEIKNFEKLKNKRRLRIGYIGSVYKSRGIETVINLAKRDHKNDYFIYGGSKSDLEKIRFKISRNNTFLHSQVSYKKIKKILIKMDVLLLPYTKKVTVSGDIGNIYNFMSPMKMFDYLGSGKIIISSNIPVLKEILKDKKNSILIKNFLNVQSWLFEINKLKFNKYRNYLLCKNAFDTGTKHTWKKRAEKILD